MECVWIRYILKGECIIIHLYPVSTGWQKKQDHWHWECLETGKCRRSGHLWRDPPEPEKVGLVHQFSTFHLLIDFFHNPGATSQRWRLKCSLQNMTLTAMEFSGDTKKWEKIMREKKMFWFSWEEGAQIVEDLENDKIDQVESLDKIDHRKKFIKIINNWPEPLQLAFRNMIYIVIHGHHIHYQHLDDQYQCHDAIFQNRPVSGKRPGSSRPVSGALEHQRINHEEFSMFVNMAQ